MFFITKRRITRGVLIEKYMLFSIKIDSLKNDGFWLACINIGRTRDILDLLSFGKNISDLMQRLSLESLSNPQESGKNG